MISPPFIIEEPTPDPTEEPTPEPTVDPATRKPPTDVLGASRVPKTGDTGTAVKFLAGLFFLAVSAASVTVMATKKKEEDEE